MLGDDQGAAVGKDYLAVDVYALGVIMWQLWFKQKPFENKSFKLIATEVMAGTRPPLTLSPERIIENLHPAPPGALVELVEACWAQRQNERPNAAQVFERFNSEVVPAVEAVSGDINLAARTVWAAEMGLDSIALPVSSIVSKLDVLKGLLRSAGLNDRHAATLDAYGIGDLESLCDEELCTDSILSNMVGLSKLEVRKFRRWVGSQNDTGANNEQVNVERKGAQFRNESEDHHEFIL